MPKKKNTVCADAEVLERPLISGGSVVAPDGGEIRSKEFTYRSGRQVLCEALMDGVYGFRYRTSTGQIVPEMHLSPPDASFAVGIKRPGQPDVDTSSGWTLEGSEKLGKCPLPELNGADPDSDIVYAVRLVHRKAGLRVTVFTLLDGSDFIERWLEIENAGDGPAGLSDVRPYCGKVWEFGGVFSDFSAVYNHSDGWGREGDFTSDSLGSDDSLSLMSANGKSGWGRPAVWLKNGISGEYLALEYAWSGNWSIDIRTDSKRWDGARQSLWVSAGMLPADKAAGIANASGDGEKIDPASAAIYVLAPGEKVLTPAVHMALLRESEDRIAQICHRHVRTMVIPPLPDGVRAVEIEANHRGYLCDRESEEGIKRDMDVAAAYGTEMYVIDAGWYGSSDVNRWWDNAGDWTPGVWLKNGLKPLVKYAHEKKMRFGLWCEFEAAGKASRLAAERPDWVRGRALDLTIPEAESRCLSEILRIADEYKIDMFRVDHNNTIGLSMRRNNGGFTEFSDWRYYEAFCRIMRKVRRRCPSLELQNCAGGGGRLDLMTLSLFHNTELSDWSRQPISVRILDGAAYCLPPEKLLRIFGTESADMTSDADIDSQLRCAVMARPILRGIAPSPESVSPWLDRRVRHSLDLFRSVLRPILDGCLVYHHRPLAERKKIDDRRFGDVVLEYAAADGSSCAVGVFCQDPDSGGRLTVFPKSVRPGHSYSVVWDSTGERALMSGLDIMRWGVPVRADPGASEMLIIKTEN